jgi:hypothetical protein
MPRYEVEQYELHVITYRVEADDEADAIAKLFLGEGDPVDKSLEFVEIADDCGMPVDENRDLADRLRDRGIVKGNDAIIPSIRSIRPVE